MAEMELARLEAERIKAQDMADDRQVEKEEGTEGEKKINFFDLLSIEDITKDTKVATLEVAYLYHVFFDLDCPPDDLVERLGKIIHFSQDGETGAE